MQNNSTYRLFEDKVDKLVHDSLTQQELPVVTTEWDSLQQRLIHHRQSALNRKNKNIYTYIGLLLLLCAGYFILFKIVQPQKINQAKNTNSKNELKENTNKAILPSITDPALSTLEQKAAQSPSRAINDEISELKQVAQKIQTKEIKNSPLHIKENRNRESYIDKEISVKDKDVLTAVKKEDDTKRSELKAAMNQNKNGKEDQTMIIVADKNPGEVKNSNQQTENKVLPDESKNPKIEVTGTIPETETFREGEMDIIKEKAINENVKPIPQKRKRTKKEKFVPEHNFSSEKQWYVEAYSGMNSSGKNKNSFAAFLAPSGYNNKRLNQETNLNSMHAGVQFKMRKDHLILSGGLSYLQLGDRINYDSAGTGSFVLNANGNTNFTYLEIPLTAGYEWANKRWGFSLQAGLSAGLLMNLSGRYVSIDNFNTNLFDVKENKSNFRKAIYNVIVNPQMNYFVNDRISLFAAPVYRRNLQPITIAESSLKQRYSSLGIQIGIRTKL